MSRFRLFCACFECQHPEVGLERVPYREIFFAFYYTMYYIFMYI